MLDYILGLVLIILASVGYLNFSESAHFHLKDRVAANDLQIAAQAAQLYLSDDAATVTSALSPGSSIIIPMVNGQGITSSFSSAQSQGLVADSFSGVDPFGQKFVIVVSEDTTSVSQTGGQSYHALVATYGGSTISNSDLGAINAMAGKLAGVLSTPAAGGQPTTITGWYGTWSSPLTNYTAYKSLTSNYAGHYASLLSFQPATSTLSTYLSRFNTGTPAANTMNTSILMNDNPISGIQSATFNSGGSVADNGSGGLAIASNLAVTGNLTGTGANTVGGNQTIAGANSNSGAKTISGYQSVASALITPTVSFGQNPVAGGATVGAICSPAGAVTAANDGNSSIVGCSNGVWTKLGGTTSGFSTFFIIGCGAPVNWVNTGTGPAIVYGSSEMTLAGNGQVTSVYSGQSDAAYELSVTDVNGNTSSVGFDSYGQGYGWYGGNTILVPAGATFSGGTSSATMCFGGWR